MLGQEFLKKQAAQYQQQTPTNMRCADLMYVCNGVRVEDIMMSTLQKHSQQ